MRNAIADRSRSSTSSATDAVLTQSTYSVAVVFLRAVAAVRLPVTAAIETVRHHHKLGLLEEPERAPSSYKRYDVRHLVRLMGIRRLTDLGVPLSDIPTVAAADARSKEILRALDAELAANIERQQHMRRQLAAILEDGASLGPPAGFRAAAATLPQAQQDLLVASSSVLTPTAMSLIRDQYTRPRDKMDEEFEHLPARTQGPR
ncbi:MerR family transcriptional regulator [Streptomyces sp. NPDC055060]